MNYEKGKGGLIQGSEFKPKKNQNSPLEELKKAIHILENSQFFKNQKEKQEKATLEFAEATSAYLKSKEHQKIMQALSKLGGISKNN
jgi:hypothetical protein